MKCLIKNNQIIQIGIPTHFTRENGELFLGGYESRTDLHYEDGWRDTVIPQYNTSTHTLGEPYYDIENDVVTYNIVAYTEEQLNDIIEQNIKAKESYFDLDTTKRLLSRLIEPILTDTTKITQRDIDDSKMLYKQHRVGVIYDKDSTNPDEKYFVWNDTLYKVIGARHTSQADWTPDTAVSLYVKIVPPGVIAPWVQPTGSHDAYQKGNKVSFNGQNYESLIDGNVWSPAAYPSGWKLF